MKKAPTLLTALPGIMLSAALLAAPAAPAQTLDACRKAAERNYPLIRQQALIEKTTALTLQNVEKAWLPQLSAHAQATLQSSVTAFPAEVQALYRQAGIDMEGLSRAQWRVGIDVQQMLIDGGATASRKALAREEGAVEGAQTATTLYQVRRRVAELYFALLLIDEQLRLNADLQRLFEASERKLAAMEQRGTASRSDLQSVQAERIAAVQQQLSLSSERRQLLAVLSAFCGMEVTAPEKPAPLQPTGSGVRPEMLLFDARLRLCDARERAVRAALMPRVGLFAQGYYGYPGYNLFRDMMGREPTWNGMVGARLTWNIGAFYTRRNDLAKIRLQREQTETGRAVFAFDNRLEQLRTDEATRRYRQLMDHDEELIALRVAVRKAAESKLEHGIIAVSDLVREIHQENAARLQQSMHEIEMLHQMYDRQYATND